jgi:hypothetical protein
MTVIRVNPESVRNYATNATELFGNSRTQLESLISAVVEVRYYGPNAVGFKTQAGQMAADFSTQLLNDFTAIAGAVQASTTAIASSLGGTPVTISVDGTPLTAPVVPPADETVDVDTSALEGLKPVVTQYLSAVSQALTDHLTSLQGTDWEGTAKTTAVETVSTYATTAQTRVTEAETAIKGYIDSQISSVTAADR